MKKNLISIIVLALVLANLILTAVLAFTIIPQTRKSNALIDQVCAAIDLELEGGPGADASAIPIENIETYDIAEGFTVNLADGNYAVFSVSLAMNTQSEGYASYKGAEGLAAKESMIRGEINQIVTTYTMDEFSSNSYKTVQDDILKSVQEMFGGNDFIVGVYFSSVNVQERK